jgi:hypothetical protein
LAQQVIHAPPADSLAMHEVERRRGDSRMVFYVYQPFGPDHLVAHAPGGAWAEAVSSSYNVRWHRPEHRFEYHITREVEGPLISASERASAEDRLERRVEPIGITVRDLPFEIPDRKAPLRHLAFDSEARLWVFLSASDGSTQSADIYGNDSTAHFTLEWPPSIDLRNGYLEPGAALGLSTDDLGVQRVVLLKFTEPE